MRCPHGNDAALCLECAIAAEPERFRLGRRMAQMLRDEFGDGAEAQLPECLRRAEASGDLLQVEVVRLAEKFLIGREPSKRPP